MIPLEFIEFPQWNGEENEEGRCMHPGVWAIIENLDEREKDYQGIKIPFCQKAILYNDGTYSVEAI